MPKIKSAEKKHRQSLKRRARNVHIRSVLKSRVKELFVALEAKDFEKSKQLLKEAESAFDKAALKGVIHKNTASRNVSRLSKKVSRLSNELESSSE